MDEQRPEIAQLAPHLAEPLMDRRDLGIALQEGPAQAADKVGAAVTPPVAGTGAAVFSAVAAKATLIANGSAASITTPRIPFCMPCSLSS